MVGPSTARSAIRMTIRMIHEASNNRSRSMLADAAHPRNIRTVGPTIRNHP